MNPDSLLGVWTGIARNSNGWDMKVTISILQPIEIGSMLGVFDIPMIPCSGTFRLITIRNGKLLELRAERLEGNCSDIDSYTLELLPDGTLEYVSKGRGWETRGILQLTNQD
jgi:hypothetical protein